MDKDSAGPHWWAVLHNIAAKYPDNPSDSEKSQTRKFVNYLIDSFVCQDCVNHAKEYIKKHGEPDYSSRKTLSDYFCKFHNTVNTRLNKPVYDCSNILANGVSHDENTNTCPTCTVKKSYVKDDLENFKKTARNIILSICKEEKVTPPSIHFQPCPDSTSTSCITYDHNRIKDGIYFGEADIYINPYSASLRTIIHEVKHYLDLKHGRPLTEVQTDNYAVDTINKYFHFDNYNNTPLVNDKLMDEQVLVTQDNNQQEIKLLPIKNDVFPTANKTVKYDTLNIKTYHDYPSLHRINNLFDKPQVYAAKHSFEASEGEVNKNIFVPDNNDDFILSGLNNIFAYPASFVGVSPSQFTMTYVGSFATNVMMYLIRSNFSTFGSSVISFLLSISLFTGSAIFKNSIGQGDRGFIQGIVANFLTTGINNLVPSKRDVFGEGIRLFIEGVKSFDLGKIKESLFFDEEAYNLNKHIQPAVNEKVEKVANALFGKSAEVSDIRNQQLISRNQFDAAHYVPNPLGDGGKNTIPNYSTSDLQSVANSYERKRQLLDAAGGTLNNLDIDELTSEISSGLQDIDSNNYEVLQM